MFLHCFFLFFARSAIHLPSSLTYFQILFTYERQGTQPTQGPPIPNLLAEMGTTLSDPEGDEDDTTLVGIGDRFIGDLIVDTDLKYRQVRNR